MIYLQLSTGQSPAECQIFARFALRQILREAEAAGVAAELLSQTGSKHGILSATFAFNGAGAEALAQRWLGTLQWIGNSPVRPKHPRKNWYIGVFRLPQIPALPDDDSIHFETCRAGGKGRQHVNKTDSAVRATHLATGVSVRVESERSQHANKKRARELLAIKLAAQHSAALAQHASHAHAQLYQVERGNPVRVFKNADFREQ
jgi:putative peptide chain release factor H